MNVSYKWLKEYVDFDMSPLEVADALTSIGLEVGAVEEVQSIKGGLEGLVVGKVLTCEAHPNSDHMHVCSVDLGDRTEQIVCGASNVAAGEKVIVATLGTKLYDGDQCFTIKKSKLRGIESNGMICAEDEIGIGNDHNGIIVLPEDTEVGMPAAKYYGLESDWVIEVDITPNHSDACSHWGVARDFYAYLKQNGYDTELHRPSCEAFKVDDSHALDIDVVVEQKEACPRYCAVTVKNCEVKESPKWLKDKLTTIGLRPINNIVDITNYIMMAYGQPLHCFDADMIKGSKVVVKAMPEGTPFVTLDGVEHKLSDKDLAICNAEEPMCIAGVFGGKGSGTYETTKDVLFESAYFHPTWIRKSARRHGLQTDASFRFERGIDPDGQIYALKQAAMLAKELAGGEIAMEIKDVKSDTLPENAVVDFDIQYCRDLIGKDIPADTMRSICENLGMKVLEASDKMFKLEVPAYRVDVQRPCDVVEEILRIYGYNNIEIPEQVKSSLTVKGEVDRSNKLQNLIGEQLVGCGFNEILNNSLTKISYYDGLEAYTSDHLVRLMNPLSQDLGALRQTLLFGGLECISHNVNRRMGDIRFFEYGTCYRYDASRREVLEAGEKIDGHTSKKVLAPYSEDFHLGLWLTGKRVNGSWAHADEETSVYELKAYVMNILQRLGVPFGAVVFGEEKNDLFSKAATISNRGGKLIVEYGVVSKKQTKKFDIDTPVYYADINWSNLMKLVRKSETKYTEIPKYPAVSRDLALLLDSNIEFARIEQIAYQSEKKLLKEVKLFDVYEGKNLEAGKKSYAVNFVLQDESKTLNDKQIEAIMTKIEQNICKQLGAKVRGK
ncbi:MAG: phenylalanine--tRNA ligase subunit beta [Prevotellaceae bacterium]|nr:phenylalanine--tRNA ligase subunit beta [Prevotellaceae bacterium]